MPCPKITIWRLGTGRFGQNNSGCQSIFMMESRIWWDLWTTGCLLVFSGDLTWEPSGPHLGCESQALLKIIWKIHEKNSDLLSLVCMLCTPVNIICECLLIVALCVFVVLFNLFKVGAYFTLLGAPATCGRLNTWQGLQELPSSCQKFLILGILLALPLKASATRNS